jgi:serine/threonine protein kinase
MFEDLRGSPYLRASVDACPDESVFVYKYLRDHLLSFIQNDVSLPIIKRVLRDALRGITALHGKGIVHTDIKANNILLDWRGSGGEVTVEQVQIADLEDAAYVPNDSVIRGRQVGNWMWRSPEAHVSAEVHTPSDMFSFGLVVSPAPVPVSLDLKHYSASMPSRNEWYSLWTKSRYQRVSNSWTLFLNVSSPTSLI